MLIDLAFNDRRPWLIPESFRSMLQSKTHFVLSDYFRNRFAGLFQHSCGLGYCQIEILTAQEMEERHPFVPNWEDFIVKAQTFLKTHEKDSHSDALANIYPMIQSIKDKMNRNPDHLRGLVNEAIIVIGRVLKSGILFQYDDYPLLIKDLKDLLMELTLLKFPTVTYGLYAHEEETIYLCYENLTQERKDVHPDVLGEAVLAHEFAHCLHFHQITQRHRSAQTNETKVHKEGLFETVAEYLQHVYVSDQLNQRQGIRDWMEHHMTAGPFPGWGYAGGGILSRYSDSHRYFQKIYETSLSDWRGAFSLINALAVFSQ